MRWPFGPPHLTLKPSKKNKKTKQNQQNTTKKNKKEKNQERKSKKHKNTKKRAFQLSVKIFLFWRGVQNAFFDTLAQKTRTQKHYKNRGFSLLFLEKGYASRNGHFWTKKPEFRNSSYHFFFAFVLFQKQKTQKSAETPIFIVF